MCSGFDLVWMRSSVSCERGNELPVPQRAGNFSNSRAIFRFPKEICFVEMAISFEFQSSQWVDESLRFCRSHTKWQYTWISHRTMVLWARALRAWLHKGFWWTLIWHRITEMLHLSCDASYHDRFWRKRVIGGKLLDLRGRRKQRDREKLIRSIILCTLHQMSPY